MAVHSVEQALPLQLLRRAWLGWVAFYSLAVLAGCIYLASAWQAEYALRWGLISGGLGVYFLVVLGANLAQHRRTGEYFQLPNLGSGTHLTILRGLFLAGAAGFLVSPLPASTLGWAAGLLFLASAIGDFFDGYLARKQNTSTRLGEKLDETIDSLGMLIGVLLAIHLGKVGSWYLLVGLARFFYLAGIFWRQHRSQPIYPLPPSMARRAMAGAQMLFTAIMLLPVFQPPATSLAAVVFSTPFLIGFTRDWLAVSGWKQAPLLPGLATPQKLWMDGLLLLIRVAAAGLGIWAMGRLDSIPLQIAFLAGALLLVAGAASRMGALLLMVPAGLSAGLHPSMLWLVGLSSLVFYLGGGKFALWQPEEWLINNRLGERPPEPKR